GCVERVSGGWRHDPSPAHASLLVRESEVSSRVPYDTSANRDRDRTGPEVKASWGPVGVAAPRDRAECAGMSRTPPSTLLARRWSGFLLLAILCAAGTWGYVERVLIPYQIAEAAAHGRPRGNASDLYPRWVGARELLIHGRDPYSPEVTRDIQ